VKASWNVELVLCALYCSASKTSSFSRKRRKRLNKQTTKFQSDYIVCYFSLNF